MRISQRHFFSERLLARRFQGPTLRSEVPTPFEHLTLDTVKHIDGVAVLGMRLRVMLPFSPSVLINPELSARFTALKSRQREILTIILKIFFEEKSTLYPTFLAAPAADKILFSLLAIHEIATNSVKKIATNSVKKAIFLQRLGEASNPLHEKVVSSVLSLFVQDLEAALAQNPVPDLNLDLHEIGKKTGDLGKPQLVMTEARLKFIAENVKWMSDRFITPIPAILTTAFFNLVPLLGEIPAESTHHFGSKSNIFFTLVGWGVSALFWFFGRREKLMQMQALQSELGRPAPLFFFRVLRYRARIEKAAEVERLNKQIADLSSLRQPEIKDIEYTAKAKMNEVMESLNCLDDGILRFFKRDSDVSEHFLQNACDDLRRKITAVKATLVPITRLLRNLKSAEGK